MSMMSAVSDMEAGLDTLRHWFSNKLDRVVEYAQFLYVQRWTGFTVSGAPEFEAQAVPFFLDLLTTAGAYLEFGMGGSTVLAAMNGVCFVSVDSDRHFMRAVKDKIKQIGRLDPERQTFIHGDIGPTAAWGIPVLQRATPSRVERWRRYLQAPWAAMMDKPGPYLVLVDGRFRVACALSAAKNLDASQTQILIDDYEGRDHYRVVERHLELRQRCGRMALFTPRADIDAKSLDADIEKYSADWR
ncbi:MAG: hypothetical protein H7124_06725 [Phycisphaerales bacterium]|nr:hypothetical protein [Hyphomonadaceae bacterium]